MESRCTQVHPRLNFTERETQMDMKTKTSGGLATLCAVAIGGLLLSNKVKVHTGTTPSVTVHRTFDVQLPVGNRGVETGAWRGTVAQH